MRESANRSGTGPMCRAAAVAVYGLGSGEASEPLILAQRTEMEYGAQLMLYPAPDGDHSALGRLLAAWPMTGTRPSAIGLGRLPAAHGWCC